MLVEFIYTSRVKEALSYEELHRIQEQAEQHNALHNITGMLLYDKRHFMQVLEGDECEIKALYEKIKCDPRHYDVEALISSPIEKRNFPSWAMGLVELKNVPKYQDTDIADIKKDIPLSYKLLLAFSDNQVFTDDAANE